MQNRSNRSLLFGSRGGGGVGGSAEKDNVTDLDAMEAQNQAGVDGLRAPASQMKQLAMHIERDVNDQNRMLDRMDTRFDNASDSINGVLSRLNEMANDTTSRKMCLLIAIFFFSLVAIYNFMKR